MLMAPEVQHEGTTPGTLMCHDWAGKTLHAHKLLRKHHMYYLCTVQQGAPARNLCRKVNSAMPDTAGTESQARWFHTQDRIAGPQAWRQPADALEHVQRDAAIMPAHTYTYIRFQC